MESTPVETYCVDNLSFSYRDATHLFSVVCHIWPEADNSAKRVIRDIRRRRRIDSGLTVGGKRVECAEKKNWGNDLSGRSGPLLISSHVGASASGLPLCDHGLPFRCISENSALRDPGL